MRRATTSLPLTHVPVTTATTGVVIRVAPVPATATATRVTAARGCATTALARSQVTTATSVWQDWLLRPASSRVRAMATVKHVLTMAPARSCARHAVVIPKVHVLLFYPGVGVVMPLALTSGTGLEYSICSPLQ
jgi:hypothetical protein